MLKLKLQSFGHLMLATDSFEKTLMLRKIETGEEGDKGEVVTSLLFLGSESLWMVTAARKSDDCLLAGKL